MPERKPTLIQVILHRHVLAAALTLGLVLLGLLLLANQWAVHTRAQALARELRAVDTVDRLLPTTHQHDGGVGCDRAGRLVLDAQGRLTVDTDSHAAGATVPHWTEAARVLAHGELQGTGPFPWAPEPVVWAARVVTDRHGDQAILVTWERLSAVRAATQMSNWLVALAILLAFAVSVILAISHARVVSRMVKRIAQSSAQMAAGDFQVQLPAQPTAEFDEVSRAVTHLAHDLDRTTTALTAERDRLLRLEGLQRQFVADASHELRAPLTYLCASLEAWKDGMLDQQEQADAVDQLYAEAQRLSGLVTQLLDLSRIESGRVALTLTSVDVAEIAADVVETLRDVAGARIILAFPAAVPPVHADHDAVRRILLNLVDNARKFTPTDGTIRLWAEADGDRVRLGVTDTGVGIDPAVLPRIWDRFARAATPGVAEHSGSGLGLAIVKSLVEGMGGTVGADSQLGHGATLWVRLNAVAQNTEL